jgi:hypothetical protein
MAYADMERRILDMWPKFEDGTYVWFCDAYSDAECRDEEVEVIEFDSRCVYIAGHEGFCTELSPGDRVKRPAPKVLDADGVEIKVDDTVWLKDGTELLVEEVNRYGARCFDGEIRRTLDPKSLTHTQPDSWERLERDADNGPCGYFGFQGKKCTGCPAFGIGKPCTSAVCTDIVRRAKAIAEKEAAR